MSRTAKARPARGDVLREPAREREKSARLIEDRDYFKNSYARKLDDEQRALEAAQDALSENAGLREAMDHAERRGAHVEAQCARALAGDHDRKSLTAALTFAVQGVQAMRAGLRIGQRPITKHSVPSEKP